MPGKTQEPRKITQDITASKSPVHMLFAAPPIRLFDILVQNEYIRIQISEIMAKRLNMSKTISGLILIEIIVPLCFRFTHIRCGETDDNCIT